MPCSPVLQNSDGVVQGLSFLLAKGGLKNCFCQNQDQGNFVGLQEAEDGQVFHRFLHLKIKVLDRLENTDFGC